MRKQNIIRIVVIAAVIAFAVWKFSTIPPVISEIPENTLLKGFIITENTTAAVISWLPMRTEYTWDMQRRQGERCTLSEAEPLPIIS